MFTYKLLNLPVIPGHLVDKAIQCSTKQDDTLNHEYVSLTHGRPLYENGKEIGRSSSQVRKRISDDFEQWVKDNITDRFKDVGVCATEEGMNFSGPHVDQTRNYSLLYIISPGSTHATTSFWSTTKPIEKYYNEYADLTLIDQVTIPKDTWCIINSKCIHSVENINQGRISIQVSLLENPWEE